MHSVEDALQQPLRQQYANFLRLVQDYEYADVNYKEKCARYVMEESEKICKRYDAVSSGFCVKLKKQMQYIFSR